MDSFEGLLPEPSWAFLELTQKQTSYATHGYHRYPAKFIPQLAARLIREHSSEGNLVIDPFMGSGTTLVEAKLLRRRSIGVDINPVAHLVAQAKTQAIEPTRLTHAMEQLVERLSEHAQPSLFTGVETQSLPGNGTEWHERLRYWFSEATLCQLAQIQQAINRLESEAERTFFNCALSHTLKSVSYWHDRSVKPMRKLDKPIPDARRVFLRHAKRMAHGNREFWNLLCERDALDIPAVAYCADARQLPAEDLSASLVVTSPPYVTSYEYADLHQLSALWFGWMGDLREFREGFIGRSNGVHSLPAELGSHRAARIVAQMEAVNPRKAREVALYFGEMYDSFREMQRVLKRGGYLCIVIGNTHLCGVEVQNAQVFAEQLESLGFSLERVILREIPSKILPRTRDKTTGKFARTLDADYVAYPTEYIVVVRKRA
ncbi:MAG: site-specific DNA-methyltransferase [Fimbriimonadales bacterium]|nr:site-specific DNA-methyltransferase [Fimbriimonadales bacterium]